MRGGQEHRLPPRFRRLLEGVGQLDQRRLAVRAGKERQTDRKAEDLPGGNRDLLRVAAVRVKREDALALAQPGNVRIVPLDD